MDGSGADCRICSAWNCRTVLLEIKKKEKNTFKESGGESGRSIPPRMKWKSKSMMEALEQESKEEIEE